MPDVRFSWAVILDLLDILEHAGYKRSGDAPPAGRSRAAAGRSPAHAADRPPGSAFRALAGRWP
jgi:hypothetical protein